MFKNSSGNTEAKACNELEIDRLPVLISTLNPIWHQQGLAVNTKKKKAPVSLSTP